MTTTTPSTPTRRRRAARAGPPRRGPRLLVGALAALLIASAATAGAGAPAASAATSKLCGVVALAPTGSGDYNVQNNNYSESGEQCVTVTEDGFTIGVAEGEIAAGGAPKSYPSLVAGCHWGRCTTTPGLPVRATDVGAARTGVNITPVKEGSWNAAYDLWFDKNKDAQGQNEGTELMIWVNGNDAPDPIGKPVAAVDIAGATWTIWQGNIGWDVISFIRDTPATTVDLPLEPFVDEAIERGATEPGDWLTSVQVGFEPWSGGEGLAMENFTLDLDAAPAAKGEKAPAQEQVDGDDAAETEATQTEPAPAPAPAQSSDEGGADDQDRKQQSSPTPTEAPAPAPEQGEESNEAPAPSDAEDSSDAEPQERTKATSTPSAAEPSASEKDGEAEKQQEDPGPAPASEQRSATPQPTAATAGADEEAVAQEPAATAPFTTSPEKTPEPKEDKKDAAEQQAGAGDRFVLQVPRDTPERGGEPDVYTAGELADAAIPAPYLKPMPERWTRLRAPLDGESTEYREVGADGDRAAWSLGRGTHSLSGTARVTHLPGGDPEVTIAQLHDDESDRLSIAAQVIEGESALVMKVNGTSKGLPRLDATYESGDAFDVELEIVGGAPRVHLDGDPVYQGKPGDIRESDENSWKAGPYAQAAEESGGGGEYAEVELRDLAVTHESAGAAAAPREKAEEKAPAKTEVEGEARTPQQTRPTTSPSFVREKEKAETKPARSQAPEPGKVSGYEESALADEPVMLLTGDKDGTAMSDVVDPDRDVKAHGKSAPATTPGGGTGVDLDGSSGYLELDGEDLSIAGTGQLTVEILMRPDKVKDLTATEGSSEGPMVHVLNKGGTFGDEGDQEWATRVYDESSQRPGRVSSYAFRPEGGEGAGSYDQGGLEAGEWVVATAVYDTTEKGPDGWGTVTMYRDGQEVDTDSLGGKYQVEPEDGGAPLYVGGGAGDGLFDGAIGAVAVYPTAQSEQQIAARADVALAK